MRQNSFAKTLKILPDGLHKKIGLREFLDVSIGQESDDTAIVALEDAEDIADAKVALAEHGFLSIAEFKHSSDHYRIHVMKES